MHEQIRIEIRGKDQFWSNAFHVEWEDQFPERTLIPDGDGHYLVSPDWLHDLESVGDQTFCRVLRAPINPLRRRWLNSLFPKRHA